MLRASQGALEAAGADGPCHGTTKRYRPVGTHAGAGGEDAVAGFGVACLGGLPAHPTDKRTTRTTDKRTTRTTDKRTHRAPDNRNARPLPETLT